MPTRIYARGGNPLDAKILESHLQLPETVMEVIADSFVEELRRYVREHQGEFYRLSDRHLKRKKRLLQDNRVLIATGAYLDTIEVTKTGKNTFSIEPSSELVYDEETKTRRDITYKDLSVILEFGNFMNNLEPRPHWKPTITKFRNRVQEILREVKFPSKKKTISNSYKRIR